jgi:glycosyltransferase involved in cell wall biosynthesis
MVIAIISEWFSENMGYAENHLPASLAKLGSEVHLVTSDLQVYGTNHELYKSIYESFLGPAQVPPGETRLNNFLLHRCPHYTTRYGIGIKDLFNVLRNIKPAIVYLFEINSETTLQIVEYQPLLRYKIFTESRLHLSVYRSPKTIKQKIHNHFVERPRWKKIGHHFEKCYPVAPDVLYVICKYFGQKKTKCVLSSLAVDMENFRPIRSESERQRRETIRQTLGYGQNDVVCLYTGRFTEDKGTVILAHAIDYLHRIGKTNFKGLFVGAGDISVESAIRRSFGCTIHPFVQAKELAKFYQAADIGVWPKQESTSQLDAAACGLPIIISSNVQDTQRINGNGLSYSHGDPIDLAKKILSLEERSLREELGKHGAEKIRQFYSWDYIAQQRINDFEKALP